MQGRSRIEYKAKIKGIELITVNESYTSGCSSLDKLIEEEKLYNKLAKNALDFSKENLLKNMAKKVDYLYSTIIDKEKKKYSENNIQKIWWAH